ncbi:polyprenyl synthetase family protein [Streptomyces halobius]|uniref:Polyprenyl synthetase family protein n=1 Tax=Streptomyces halobius TaxID=2879846 RepID=A0ABY4LYU7_9ACTN|nr:polyprenyl synthetase family protein [Streptomyces halobius]UQA90638.1 polyprenyl synthetase family protein [Streptomyces halobius]
MTTPALREQPFDPSAIRNQVACVLSDFLARKSAAADAQHLPADVVQALGDFLTAGGKRLRPILCVMGWHAAGGHGDTGPVVRVGAALEMFHAFCLIHDDVMDNSCTRRGAPTVHRALARAYTPGRSRAAADFVGTSAAILIGDLALAWSDELFHTAGLDPAQLSAVLPLLDAMRTEVMYGQYLDVTSSGQPTADLERALTILRYKTAKYTLERPLHIGAVLAGGNGELLDSLSDFALPVGDAFQLRDDLLGVYGDPRVTGKSRLDDLREGKQTVLIALAMRNATPARQHTMSTLIGNPALDEEGAERARQLVTATGAYNEVRRLIQTRRRQAERVLERLVLPPGVANALRELARAATQRRT